MEVAEKKLAKWCAPIPLFSPIRLSPILLNSHPPVQLTPAYLTFTKA